MIPPVIRRCPECGHVDWNRRFRTVVVNEGTRRVECPACDHRFGRPHDAWRN